jgi:hypothetical protein
VLREHFGSEALLVPYDPPHPVRQPLDDALALLVLQYCEELNIDGAKKEGKRRMRQEDWREQHISFAGNLLRPGVDLSPVSETILATRRNGTTESGTHFMRKHVRKVVQQKPGNGWHSCGHFRLSCCRDSNDGAGLEAKGCICEFSISRIGGALGSVFHFFYPC